MNHQSLLSHPYKLVSGTWCTQLSLRIRCIQYLQILARFRYILVLASSMSCMYRCWVQCMKADAAWCPQCRDTCLLLLELGTIMATRAANWIEWLLLLQSGHNNSQQNLGSALNWQLTFSYDNFKPNLPIKDPSKNCNVMNIGVVVFMIFPLL